MITALEQELTPPFVLSHVVEVTAKLTFFYLILGRISQGLQHPQHGETSKQQPFLRVF